MIDLMARRIEETAEFVAAERERHRRARLCRQIAALQATLDKVGKTPPRYHRERWFRLFNRLRSLQGELDQLELPL